MTTRLYALATATAPHEAPQSDIARFVGRVLAEQAPPRRRDQVAARVRALFDRSAIETRYSALPDFTCEDPEEFSFFPRNWALAPVPTTAERMAVYAPASVELAARAGSGALRRAGVEPRAVTHLIVATCTGFFAPGPDVALIERLGLPRTVARTIVGFMGCYAGFTALRLADDIVRADPDAIVLTVAVELCSLHFQRSLDLQAIVASALFGDGASAAVYARPGRFAGGLGEVLATRSFVAPDSRDDMRWTIGDHGFEMTLGPRVPAALAEHAAPFLGALLDRARVRREPATGFAIHPGGRRIIDAVASALEIDGAGTESARAVLRRTGNLSSAAILFVLERELARSHVPRHIVALGFGPGLTMEGAVLRAG